MLKLLPMKILGTIVCAAALFTGTVHAMSQAELKKELETMKQKLSITTTMKDSRISDPQYKRTLNFIGSWFMGDQVGEEAVGKGVGSSKMDAAHHLYTLLPILKKSEALGYNFDVKLDNQVDVIENAINIHEIILKLSDPAVDSGLKNSIIADLNDKIFETAKDMGTVLIPVAWKGPKPGNMLLSLLTKGDDYILRIFDTVYNFTSNRMIPDANGEYPQRIVPWKEIRFTSDNPKLFKLLIPGLLVLLDDAQLKDYLKAEDDSFLTNLKKFFLSTQSAPYDVGRIYLYSKLFPSFGDPLNPGFSDTKSWPLSSLEIGPVGNILAYFTSATSNYKNYYPWKLGISYILVKNFLDRYASDADIHIESRTRIVVAEIVKRGANRLLRDAFELAKVEKWMPKQVGEADNDFWKHLHYSVSDKRDYIETTIRKIKDMTKFGSFKFLKTALATDKDKMMDDLKALLKKDFLAIDDTRDWALIESDILTKLDQLMDRDCYKLHPQEEALDLARKDIQNEKNSLIKNDKLYTGTSDKNVRKGMKKEFGELSKNIDKTLEAKIASLKKQSEEFKKAMEEREAKVDSLIKTVSGFSLKDFNNFNLSKFSSSTDKENQIKLKLIKEIMQLRERAFAWIKENPLDTHKLTKITRSLGQREISAMQNTYVVIDSLLEKPADLTDYNTAGQVTPDFSNCMSGIDIEITSLREFIDAFSPMQEVWYWTRFSYDVPYPHCRSFFRRNSELLLQNLKLGGLDKDSLSRWTPFDQKEYKQFIDLAGVVLNTVSDLPATDKTLEDYLIVMRLQRIIWRVAQALDSKFALVQPQRHLDLVKYSLAFPQCHKLIQGDMSYANYFLADSGAFGNILSHESVSEMKNLCRTLIEDERAGKPVLNYEKYTPKLPILVDSGMFDRVDPADREIYFKMGQNPQIAQTVSEKVDKYKLGESSVAGNAARAASMGYAGSQFIYYQFFDALRIIFTANIAFNDRVKADSFVKLTYIPVGNMGSIMPILRSDSKSTVILEPVNQELLKKTMKSYLKTSMTEMVTSHILGLDVIVNHIGRGSPKFWSSGSILEKGDPPALLRFIQTLTVLFKDITTIFGMFSGVNLFGENQNRFNVKVFRKDVAGSADFFLNCSAHLLRKLDVAPGYEELVMTLLMKTFVSVDADLTAALKELEKIEEVEFEQDKKNAKDDKDKTDEDKEKSAGKEEVKKNNQYLQKGKTTPDERLKSLINWAMIAIRFSARIRSLKPEWKDRYPDIPKRFYSTMIKYSRAQKANNRRLARLDKNLVAHVDYLLFMICAMNPNDHNLRTEVYENLKPDVTDNLSFPQDSSVMPTGMVFHRMLSLSQYEKDNNGPITEDFIDNQFGIKQVMESILLLSEQNEAFLSLMAKYISPYLGMEPKSILDECTQGDNLVKGVLIYERFSINLIQGTFTENGAKARDPNSVLRYKQFREFFASGNEQFTPTLGRETNGCSNRYEVSDFLQKGSHYSICEDTEDKKIAIYRHIPRFRKPCLLVRNKRAINALQKAFSVYTNEGVDLFQCKRGNNAHFVWIARNAVDASYVSHGRLSVYYDYLILLVHNEFSKSMIDLLKDTTKVEFDLDLKIRLVDKKPNMLELLTLPIITFPKLEIRDIDDTPVFPLTAESKLQVVPEPMIRFSGGSQFGSYTIKDKLVFMFQQFRFRDRPEVSLTFVENSDGTLEMKGREDLKVCEDQIFENNFWPALMLRKTGESGERRFAYVPIANSEAWTIQEPGITDEISVKYDPESIASGTSSELNSSIIFMEEFPVEKYPISEIKTADGTTHVTYGYKLKPTSRLQRLLLAFHNLKLRNYNECLKLLDPRSEIDHNTPLSDEEIKILRWMVELQTAQEAEGFALRIMAKIHLILDVELFPKTYETEMKGSKEPVEDISDVEIKTTADLLSIYKNKKANIKYDKLDSLDLKGSFKSIDSLGRYFAFLPVLPKRFHVDQVFREALGSLQVQEYLMGEFSDGIRYNVPLPEKPFEDERDKEDPKCKYDGYLNDARLDKNFFTAMSVDDEKKLDEYIRTRFTIPYATNNCDLPRLLVHKLFHIHDANMNIPRDLQELAVLFHHLNGNQYTAMEKYVYIFSHPQYLFKYGVTELRSKVDINQIHKDSEPIVINGVSEPGYPKTLVAISSLLNRAPSQPPIIFALHGDIGASTPAPTIIEPLLPKAPDAEVAAKEREIDSIKFMEEDKHYIRAQDRDIYESIIKTIDNARLASLSGHVELAAFIKDDSKTQKGLDIAIKDYMSKCIKPIKYDDLQKDPFKPLKEHISERVKTLSADMKKSEGKYARFYLGAVNAEKKNTLPSITILSSLKRTFNNDGIPSLKDLRDCFMQMSRSCLRNRLPEMPESSIVKIAQVLKVYYIQTIIFNNLNSINAKIKEFDRLAVKAVEAEKKLVGAKGKDIKDVEDEIFDHKDTALLSAEDIYVDMKKLLQMEQRLKDPVTLNFEFMSAKFHLTDVQVVDIANLASKNWSEELKNLVIEKYIKEFMGKKVDFESFRKTLKKSTKFEEAMVKFGILAQKFKIDDQIKTLPAEEQIEKLRELWAFMPRNERRIDQSTWSAMKTALYKDRPVLKQLKSIGELQPYDPIKDSYFSRVIQRKMAAGKTTVLGTAATVKKADGKTLSVLVILSSLYQSSAPDMQKRTSEFFNTRGFAFSMPKPRLTVPKPHEQDHPARRFLLWTLKTLITTINSNSYLVVTPETLQSFLNSYVEFLDAFISTPSGRLNPELSRCLHLFATIYDIFRSRGSIILDEIDSSMRPQKELNFPTTKRESILLSGVELTSDLLLHSALNKEINEAGLNLLANQQAALNDDQYNDVRKIWKDYVRTQLNDKNSLWHRTFFPINNDPVDTVDGLIKFFFESSVLDRKDSTALTPDQQKELDDEINRLAEIKKKSLKIFHVMMVVKMQFKNWLRDCFKGSVNEHYGPSLNKAGQKALYYAIPYMAANTPAEGSIFADRWETVNKTFMMYLVKNLTLEDLSMILLDLRTISQSSAQGIDIKAEFATACTGFDLLNLKFNAQNRLVDKSGNIMKCMKARSPSALKLIFYWVTKMVFETEQFYAEQITSNAINLTTMFPSVQGYSGTIDNVNILPHQVMIEAEIDHRKNEQANGAITMKLLQQKDCVTTVQKIEEITQIDKILDAMCRDFPDLSAFSAFIDAGALLKDFSNAEVAFALGRKFKRDIILFYDERTNQLSFHDPKNGPTHMTALEGSETKYLNSATNSIVKNRFTYYDQRHITGSDILQPPTAKAFLTIGPKVLLRDILQGVMRMRQFQSGQSIHFITTSAVETLLSKYCHGVEPPQPDGKPRVQQKHLIALGALNEDEKQLAENVRLYRVKIDAEIRAFVLDKITEALVKADPYVQRVEKAPSHKSAFLPALHFGLAHEDLFTKTRSLFIRNVQENPVNWASINTLTETLDAVTKYRDQRIDMVPLSWKTKTDLRWQQVEDNLNVLVENITDKDKLDEKELLKKARSVLNYLGPTLEVSEISPAFAATSSVTVGLGSTIEMELQLELQQELELELEQQILDNTSQNFLPEPVLSIPQVSKPAFSLASLMGAFSITPAKSTPDAMNLLNGIQNLYTPWSLLDAFGGSGSFSAALKDIYLADIFCPGLKSDEKDIKGYCKGLTGFVGMSRGLAKVTTSKEIDFVTMASREGTHLLFWRGRTAIGYTYAVFLISGSEAMSLHQNWSYRSCSIDENSAFWLTDLYGFEVHGTPFASTSVGSNHFSLLESEYNDNFAALHFRALLLNASYNVIMTDQSMYNRMRAWVGDFAAMKSLDPTCKTGLKRDIALKRVSFFINRLTWMSKLRDEIVPDDPFIRDIMRIYANQPVDFDETASKYKEDLKRGQTETYTDTMTLDVIDPDDARAKPWKTAKNVNESEPIAFFVWIVIILVILVLVGIVLAWGYSTGIDWKEFFGNKWIWFLALFKKTEESEESPDNENSDNENSQDSASSASEAPADETSETN